MSLGSFLVGRSLPTSQRMVQQIMVLLKSEKHLQTFPARQHSDRGSSSLVSTLAVDYLDVLLDWAGSLHSLSSHTAALVVAGHTLADHENSPASRPPQMCLVSAFPLSFLDPHPMSTLQSPASRPAPNTSHCPASRQLDPIPHFQTC